MRIQRPMNARLRLLSAACASALLAGWAIAQFRSGPSPAEPGSHVAAAPSPRATNPRVTISTEGALSRTLLGAPDERLGSLVRADASHQRGTLDRLRLRLERLAAIEALGDGPALGALDVASDPATPWLPVLWVLELATSPTIRTRKVRLPLPDAPESAVTPELS